MNPNQESVGFCDSSKVGPPLNEEDNATEKVFSNTLLWKIIGSYLNVGDLKACRLVNSGFRGMIMKETNFLQRSLVTLNPDQITRNIFGSTREQWKNVVLKFQSPGVGPYCKFSNKDLKNLAWLYPVISSVESLSLRMKEGTKGGKVSRLLKLLLKAPKKLRSLAVEPIFLIIGTAGQFEEVKAILGNLEEFEILEPSPRWLLDVDSWKDIDPWWVSFDFIKQLDNLRVVKSYYPQRLLLPECWSTICKESKILTSVLNRIAKGSSTTLKHVTLGESRLLYQKGEFTSQFMPNKTQPGAVSKFFEAMPMLQEVDFTVWWSSFPIEILNMIEEKSDCLRKVKLVGENFKGTKWEFLANTKLEEFQLGVRDPWKVLNTLPSGAQNNWPSTIRRLSMHGQFRRNPFPALARLDPTLVTQLTFIHSGKYFRDNAIKYICGNFVMLRKLNLTNVERVTDAGFVGSSSGSGSLSGIKGLRTLILRECGSISDATLKEIRFLELSYLDLSINENVTEEGLEGILSNNSSLETLVTSCENVYSKRENLCANHPRLSCVKLSVKVISNLFGCP